ncbi:MAG: PIG-L family deacetylase [Chloroflexi bacterium]|nr:PIG-L family deacetylase [Chloroflexota bacterium]
MSEEPAPTDIDELVADLEPRRALVMVAHPDDADFGCAGTMALLCRAGWEVDLLVATNGNKGTKDPNRTGQQLAAVREEEQRRAAAILGVNEPIFLGFPDGYVRADDELRGLLVRELRRLRPSLAITFDGFRAGFNHRDHRLIGQSAYDAIYPAADDHLFYPEHREEGLEPHRPDMLLLSGATEPDVIVDIEPVIELKIAAITAHVSQVGGRSPEEMLRWWRERAGPTSGPRYRESFRKVTWERARRSADARRGRRRS